MPLISSLGILNAIGLRSTKQTVASIQYIAYPSDDGYGIAFKWQNGFSTKYVSSSTTGGTNSPDFHPLNNAIAYNMAPSGYSPKIYTFSSNGFGSLYAGSYGSNGYGASFSKLTGNSICFGQSAAPYVRTYAFNVISGVGTQFTNPATTPTGQTLGVQFNFNETALAIFHATNPYVTVYPWSTSGYGTKFSNPATAVAGTGRGGGFSTSGSVLAIGHDTAPLASLYSFSSSGFGTKYANPSTALAGTIGGFAKFTILDSQVILSTNATPAINAYSWSSSGFGTKYANPSVIPDIFSAGSQLSFSSDETAIAIGDASSVYPWSASGFGTRYALATSTTPITSSKGVSFSR